MADLTQPEQIRQWWTNEARIENAHLIVGWSGLGWEVELVTIHDPATHTVVWHCLRSNMQNTQAWEGTTISFVLTPQAAGTRVDFAQTGYRESPCRDVCVQGWAFFVGTSLKQYVETDRGIPYPHMQDTRHL